MRVAAFVLLAGCGRFGFDARPSTSDGATDTPRDTPRDTSADTSADTASDGPALCSGLYCDDFEGAGLDARWMLDTFHGSAVLDTTRAHSGTQSLHVHTNAIGVATTNPRGALITYDALPVTGTIYLRVWIYKASPRPAGFFDQTINFADAAGDGISTGAKDGMVANNDYTVPQTYQQSATTTEPVDAWTCWIFQMPSGTTGPTRVLLDGTEVTDAKIDVTSTQPAPDHVYLGSEFVGTPTSLVASDAWLDDVELATQPIGCN